MGVVIQGTIVDDLGGEDLGLDIRVNVNDQ
jgi:hypothetical protein